MDKQGQVTRRALCEDLPEDLNSTQLVWMAMHAEFKLAFAGIFGASTFDGSDSLLVRVATLGFLLRRQFTTTLLVNGFIILRLLNDIDVVFILVDIQ